MSLAVYVYVSYRLFVLTNTLKEVVIPNKTGKEMTRNFVTVAVSAILLLVAGAVVIRTSGLQDLASPTTPVLAQPHFDP